MHLNIFKSALRPHSEILNRILHVDQGIKRLGFAIHASKGVSLILA